MTDKRELFSEVSGNARNHMAELHGRKEVAESRRISLSEVSRATGVDRRTLSKWYSNDIDVYHVAVIAALCKYYDCTPGDLIGVPGAEQEDNAEEGQKVAVAAT